MFSSNSRPGFSFFLSFFLIAMMYTMARADLSPRNLRCEYLTAPLNVDVDQPRLSWTLTSDERGDKQSAYQILVASSPEILAENHGDLWDSGKTPAVDSIQIAYTGQKLSSDEACFWKVRVWNRDDRPSSWSDVSRWNMGLLSPQDWHGKWIAAPAAPTTQPMPLFRHNFVVASPLTRATIYLCGLGQFELHVNGVRIGSDLLQPGWTDYRKTCLYVAYDITDRLKSGDAVIAVMLGNGMYDVPAERYHKFIANSGPPMLIAELRLDYTDGTSEFISSDHSWKTSPGPITFTSIYGGEDYDARLEQLYWDQIGFDDATWSAAVETDGPGGKLLGCSASAPPIRVAAILNTKKITQPRPGTWVYDLGQNCAMIPRIVVHGPAGAQVRLTPGELLASDGTVTQASSGRGAYYQYTLRDGPPQTWSPRFSYYGARYLQVQGALPDNIGVQGLFITSTSPQVGEFSCSNDLFTRVNPLIQWAMRSNMLSILTDCPHREKLGWLEQDHLMGPSLMYNYDIAALMNKVCADMSAAQLDSGLVPDTAPEYTIMPNGFRDSPEWGSAAVLLPWNLYSWHGDVFALKTNYDMMRRYVAYLGSKSNGNLLDYGLGDWYDLGPRRPGVAQLTPIGLTATAFYYEDLMILQKSAALLGRTDDAAADAQTAVAVRDAFNRKYFNPATSQYATGSQTADALPLVFGLVSPESAGKVLENLVADIRRRDDALTAGDVGYRYVLRALADGGRSDVIYDMNRRSDRPGYGWQLDHGATSLTEAWNADPRSSQNHFMLGHIMEWFYTDLAGIQQAPDSIAFNHLRIRPAPVGDLNAATATYNSPRGIISTAWHRVGHKLTLDVIIPPGVDAMVYLPVTSPDAVTESGKPAAESAGIKFVNIENGNVVFAVESGHYNFHCN